MKRFNLMSQKQPEFRGGAPARRRSGGSEIENLMVFVPVIIALGIVYFLYTRNDMINKSVNPMLLGKLKNLKQTYESISGSGRESGESVSKLLSEKQALTNKLSRIKEADAYRNKTMRVLMAVRDTISEKITITMIEKKPENILLEGIAQDNESLSLFMETLSRTDVIRGTMLKRTEFSDEYGPYKQKFLIEGKI